MGGISADYEGEAGDAGAAGYGGFASGDRTTMQLPPVQTELMKALKKTGRPLILVNMSGSVMNFDWESRNADAILQAWYGGQAAGDAIVDVRYPFGYGLSYTTFTYAALSNGVVKTSESIAVSTTVTNTGERAGDEVVQLYVSHPQNGNARVPLRSLKGFTRIHLDKGESRQVTFTLSPDELSLVDDKGNLVEKAGSVELFIGGG